MGNIVLQGATSGATTLTPTDAVTITATFPSLGGTVMVSGNMPAFSAYPNANQTLSNTTWTKIQCNTKIFDTNNNFDATTNYRFTPTVAGYYQINFAVIFVANGTGIVAATIYKNGVQNVSAQIPNNSANGSAANGSGLIYLNGSTDYIELWALQTSGGNLATNSTVGTQTYFNGSMVRSA